MYSVICAVLICTFGNAQIRPMYHFLGNQVIGKRIVTFKRVPNHRRLLIIDDKTFVSLPNKQRRASTRLASSESISH